MAGTFVASRSTPPCECAGCGVCFSTRVCVVICVPCMLDFAASSLHHPVSAQSAWQTTCFCRLVDLGLCFSWAVKCARHVGRCVQLAAQPWPPLHAAPPSHAPADPPGFLLLPSLPPSPCSSYNTIFLFLFACVAFGMGSCATGQTARLPIVADAADAQVR